MTVIQKPWKLESHLWDPPPDPAPTIPVPVEIPSIPTEVPAPQINSQTKN